MLPWLGVEIAAEPQGVVELAHHILLVLRWVRPAGQDRPERRALHEPRHREARRLHQGWCDVDQLD
jgi:hypothetical protein